MSILHKTIDCYLKDRKRVAALFLNSSILRIIITVRRPAPDTLERLVRSGYIESSDLNRALPPAMRLLRCDLRALNNSAITIAWARMMRHINQAEALEWYALAPFRTRPLERSMDGYDNAHHVTEGLHGPL
jgi:hypothetical protein